MQHCKQPADRTPSWIVGLVAVLVVLGSGCENPAVSQTAENPEQGPPSRAVESEPEDAAEMLAQVGPGTPTPRQPAPAVDPRSPFAHRIPIPEFPRDLTWLNTKPLRKKDLAGKFVLLDFWTYCCINCMHVLPELKKAERAYPNNLVVIGVHSAKFDAEKDTKNIREAILRYEIEHPVINDHDHELWDNFGVTSWPTLLLIDPEGNAVWGSPGETKFETIDEQLKLAIPYYRARGTLDESPVRFELEAHTAEETPLRFPGKVLADGPGDRLFIADSNHNRIVVSTLGGKLIETIGSGAIGDDDGDFAKASFDHPQGMALAGDALYVADTENHLIRKVDLKAKRVTTIAGTGEQAATGWPGLERLGPSPTIADLPKHWVGRPLRTAISSPWALWVQDNDLYIAMAGPHQIWKLKLDGSEIGPYAGNGREDIVDGPLLPQIPYTEGYCSFAQPSGLSSDGTWLYVADSEGSSIRAVPLARGVDVRTVVGTQDERFGRLFKFGFEDGAPGRALLQHVLDVVYHDGKLYAADAYNNAIREIDAESGIVTTLAGVRAKKRVMKFNPATGATVPVMQNVGEAGFSDRDGSFDEPAGITFANGTLFVADTNNHAIRTIDLHSKKVGTLAIDGLQPPAPPKQESKPTFPGAHQVPMPAQNVRRVDGAVKFNVALDLAAGWKINEAAPMAYYVEATTDNGVVDRKQVGKLVRVDKPGKTFELTVPVTAAGTDKLKVSLNYYYCQEGDAGLCKVGAVVWTVPLTVNDSAEKTAVLLPHRIKD